MLAFMTSIESISRVGSCEAGVWPAFFQSGDTADFDDVVNCAGLGAQVIAQRTEGYPLDRIPRQYLAKGNYFRFAGKPLFHRLIYPAPVEGGLGRHVTIDVGGRIRFGPDVEWIDEIDYQVDASRGAFFYDAIHRYWPSLPDGAITADHAGIMPKISSPGESARDFVIEGPAQHGLTSYVAMFGIESPGLTSSLSLAETIAEMLETK